MGKRQIEISTLIRRGGIRYEATIQHEGLNEIRVISDKDVEILKRKVTLQLEKWDKKWEDAQEKINNINKQLEYRSEAERQTAAAKRIQAELHDILLHTLDVNDIINLDSLKDTSSFSQPHPDTIYKEELASLVFPSPPELRPIPKEPDPQADFYIPNISTIDSILPFLKNKKIRQSRIQYEDDLRSWQSKKIEIENINKTERARHEKLKRVYEDNLEKLAAEHKQRLQRWEEDKFKYHATQKELNEKVDKLKSGYEIKSPDAVVEYCEMVLNNSEYPEAFQKDFDLDYVPETGILVVEYGLPAIHRIPTLSEVRYVASKNELREVHLTESQVSQLYDSVIYQITLRSIHELFEADNVDALKSIVFNGWVFSIDKASGNFTNTCIVSLHVTKTDFEKNNLKLVDPKACFKSLKGVGSSKLSGMAAIQPILQLNKDDKRFVNSYSVVGDLNQSTNLALMDWEDFEHLIRELFEAEYKTGGGEVKVTQASRDGGVDAVAFDPDPIRGGRIVIQAKRYTNTVGVSAVRDLYGTVINEGATKGILVTTSDYGPDAYDFIRGKPLTLLNGSNLLSLLEKHGHKAHIDIKAAKSQTETR